MNPSWSWQRSRYVASPGQRYAKSEKSFALCEAVERVTIRGPGVVGTPGCNVVARLPLDTPDEVLDRLIEEHNRMLMEALAWARRRVK